MKDIQTTIETLTGTNIIVQVSKIEETGDMICVILCEEGDKTLSVSALTKGQLNDLISCMSGCLMRLDL